jgi:hypothetical protein
MNRTQLEAEVRDSRGLLLLCFFDLTQSHPLHSILEEHLTKCGAYTPPAPENCLPNPDSGHGAADGFPGSDPPGPLPIQADPSVPETEAHFRDSTGKTVARIVNMAPPGEHDTHIDHSHIALRRNGTISHEEFELADKIHRYTGRCVWLDSEHRAVIYSYRKLRPDKSESEWGERTTTGQ